MTALKRQLNTMPEFVREALLAAGLIERYNLRPPYQQNDYMGWITRGKRQETRLKRLEQMLGELKAGDKYMGMDYQAKV